MIAALIAISVAWQSTKLNREVVHRELLRNLISTLHSIVSEELKITNIILTVNKTGVGLKYLKKHKANIDKMHSHVISLEQDARNHLEDLATLRAKPADEIDKILITAESNLKDVIRNRNQIDKFIKD